MNEDWMSSALCKTFNIPHNLFFPEIGYHPEITLTAKQVCNSCNVKDECLEYAIEHNIRDGIWGGMTKLERKKLRRVRVMIDKPA